MLQSPPWMGVLTALCLTLTATEARAQAPPGFLESLDVRVVNLEVYVTDRQGDPTGKESSN